MFQQSNSRNSRGRGSKVKTIIQMALFLVITIWLFYQIKHSQDKMIENIGGKQQKLSNGDGDIHLGRKEKAGSQIDVGRDNDSGGFDNVSETKDAEHSQGDAFEQHHEEKDGEATSIKEHEESQEDIMDGGSKENQQKEQHNEDDNADSHINVGDEITWKVSNEEGGEVLQLPNKEESDSSLDQTENTHTQSDIGVTGNDTGGVVSEEISSDDEHAIINLFSEQSNAVLTDNEVVESDTWETQGDSNPDAETSEHHTMEAGNASTQSEDEVGNSSVSSQENNVVTLADGEPPKREATESHADSASQAEIAGSNSLEEVKTSIQFEDEPASLSQADDRNNIEMQTEDNTSEVGKQESHVDDASDAEVTNNNAVEGNLDPQSSDGLTNLSPIQGDEKSVDKPAKVDATDVEAAELQGNASPTVPENSSRDSPGETRTRTISDLEMVYNPILSGQKELGNKVAQIGIT